MDSNILKDLYRNMLRIRKIEEKIAELYPEQQMRCPVHLCIGQEAVSVGVCHALDKKDYVMSGHRSHGHYLAKGGDLKAMMAEIYGKATGCSNGKGGSMHLVDLSLGFLGSTPIVGSTIPIAVGAAFGSVLKRENRVTVIFFGEGATEEGVFHESVNFAVLKNLPVLFICENNLYSVYSPLSVRQPKGRDVIQLAQGHAIESRKSDGNNVGAVYQTAFEAVKKIRRGGGPIFLEYETYRWREHCGPHYDNDIGYRTEEEFKSWVARCPIQRVEKELESMGQLNAEEKKKMAYQIDQEIAEAVSYALKSPFPEPSGTLEGVYAQ